MDIKGFLGCIRDFAALEWAEEWDNPGIMIGDRSWKVSRIAVSLDASDDTISDAVDHGCDLLVTHHPLIFSPLAKIDMSDLSSRLIYKAIKNKLGIVSLHTNWDVSPLGVNVCLSRKIGLSGIIPLCDGANGSWGMGALGEFASPAAMDAIAIAVKKAWNLSWLMAYGKSMDGIRRIALCGGSGGDLWKMALKKEADLYITADMKYHQILEARSEGLALMVVDHGEMERVSMPVLADLILDRTGVPVEMLSDPGDNCKIFSDNLT